MLKVTFDFSEADRLAGGLDRLTGAAGLQLAAIDAVNAVVKRADVALRAAENANLNLSDAYVKSKTDLSLATSAPYAQITTRGDLTILGRYPVAQQWQPAKGKARGDPKRGIPVGNKQAGVRVDIKPSAPTYQSKWFTMTLRRGTQPGDSIGVFVRTSAGLKHIYGPSPYSLFRFQSQAQFDQIADDLEREAIDQLGKRANEVLS